MHSLRRHSGQVQRKLCADPESRCISRRRRGFFVVSTRMFASLMQISGFQISVRLRLTCLE